MILLSITWSALHLEYLRFTRDQESDSEIPDNAVAREALLLRQTFEGFGDAARASVNSENFGTTAGKVGLNAAIGVGLGLMARGGNFGGIAAKTFASAMTIAFASDVLLHAGKISDALIDNWQSSDHWKGNVDIIRRQGGSFLFDTALMTVTGIGAGRLAHSRANHALVEPGMKTSTRREISGHNSFFDELLFGPTRSLRRNTAQLSLSRAETLAWPKGAENGRFIPVAIPEADPVQMQVLRKIYPKLFETHFAERVSQTVAAVLEQPIWQENLAPKLERFGVATRLEQHFAEKIAAGGGTPGRVAAREKYDLQRAELSLALKGIINGRAESISNALEPLFYKQQLPPFEFKPQFMGAEGAASSSSYTFEVNPLLLANKKYSAALFNTMMHEYVHINQNYLISRKAATDIGLTGTSATAADQVAELVATRIGKNGLYGNELFRSAIILHAAAEPLSPIQKYMASRLADAHIQYPYTGRIGYLENRGLELQRHIDLLEVNDGQRAAENVIRALSTPDAWLNIFNQQRGGTRLSYALFERSVPEFVETMKFDWLSTPKDNFGKIKLAEAQTWNAEDNRQRLLEHFRRARDQVRDTYARAARSYYENILERQAHQATFLMPAPQLSQETDPNTVLALSRSMAPTDSQRQSWRGEFPPANADYNNHFWNDALLP